MNLNHTLALHKDTRPEKPAVVDTVYRRPRSLSFAQLHRAVLQLTALMLQAGLKPGDAVVVLMPLRAELYVTLLTLFRLGLTGVLFNPAVARRDVEHWLGRLSPRGLVAGRRAHLLRFVSPALRRIPVKIALGRGVPGTLDWYAAGRLPAVPASCVPYDANPALVTLTSGSTGMPKAVPRSFGHLTAQYQALTDTLGPTPRDIDLVSLPLFGLVNLASGVTSVLPDVDIRHPWAIDGAPLMNQILSQRVTRITAAPAFLERLVEYCGERSRTLDDIERVLIGGGPAFPSLLDRSQAVFPSAEITVVYGSTEAEPIAHVSWSRMNRNDRNAMLGGRGLLVGRPVPRVGCRVLPDRWGRPIGPYTPTTFAMDCMAPGEAGEIVVCGPHVLPGYLDGRGEPEFKFDVGEIRWHRTGDAGYLDDRGRLWLLGRCEQGIRYEDHGIYPFSVECPAHQHPSVRRAAFTMVNGRRVLALELKKHGKSADIAGIKRDMVNLPVDVIKTVRRMPVDRRHSTKIDYPRLCRLLKR